MKILILGAAGQVSRLLTAYLLDQTKYNLVLYARDARHRLRVSDPGREEVVDGDFLNLPILVKTMQGADAVYINDMSRKEATANILKAMKEAGVRRVIVASVLGIYDEVPCAFGKWNKRMVGSARIKLHQESAALVEIPDLDYTILRLTWLYNQEANKRYMLTSKGEPFEGAQVTREAVAQLIVDILTDSSGKYLKTSLGVSEPGTNWDKPSFY